MTSIARWKDLCLDAEDPVRLGSFWAAVLGMELDGSRTPPSLVGDAAHDRIWVNPVDRPRPDGPEQNRVHLDVHALLAAGASRLWETERWTVLGDPEGHEFYVFPPA